MMQQYLQSRFQDGGRGEAVAGHRRWDCWGITRSARHELLGLPLLPSYGAIAAADKRALTRAAREVMAAGFVPVPARPGAIATCWRHGLCQHVGLVIARDGRLGVLDTSSSQGPRWRDLAAFELNHLKVIYYDDRDLSQHPAR